MAPCRDIPTLVKIEQKDWEHYMKNYMYTSLLPATLNCHKRAMIEWGVIRLLR